MSVATALIQLATMRLPTESRDRYREEWAANLRDAPSMGIRPIAVVIAALVIGFRLSVLDSTRQQIVHLQAFAVRHIRLGMALFVIVPIPLVGAFIDSALIDADGMIRVLVAIVFWVQIVVALGAFIAGAGLLWNATSFAATGSRLPRKAVSLGLVGGMLGAGCLVVMFEDATISDLGSAAAAGGIVVGLSLALVGGICGLIAWSATEHSSQKRESVAVAPWSRRVAGITSGIACLAIVAIGLVVSLVWSPMGQGPGLSLGRIYALVNSADGNLSALIPIFGWGIFWAASALALMVISLVPHRETAARFLSPRNIVTLALGVVAAAIFFQWFAYFSLGASLGDDVPPYSGGSSIDAIAYAVVGQGALIAVVIRTIGPRRIPAAPLVETSSLVPSLQASLT